MGDNIILGRSVAMLYSCHLAKTVTTIKINLRTPPPPLPSSLPPFGGGFGASETLKKRPGPDSGGKGGRARGGGRRRVQGRCPGPPRTRRRWASTHPCGAQRGRGGSFGGIFVLWRIQGFALGRKKITIGKKLCVGPSERPMISLG